MNDTTQSTAMTVAEETPPPQGLVKAQLTAGATPRALVPVDFDGAYRIANVVVRAGMAPRTLQSVEKAMVAILHGLEVGLTPMNALQSIAVINGRPTIWGDGAIGLIRASGLLEYMQETFEGQGDTMTAVCTVKRKGEPKPVRGEFSYADAKKAGLLSKEGPWQTYPRRMMQMRARWPLRDVFADVLKGLHLREEVEDMDRQDAPAEPERRRVPPPPPVEGTTAPAEVAPAAVIEKIEERQDPISTGPASGFPGDKPMKAAAPADAGELPWELDRKLSDDNRDWLRSLKDEFSQCTTLDEIASVNESVMMPAKETTSPYVWQKAVDLMDGHIERINRRG